MAVTNETLDCPETNEELLSEVSFWMEGVFQTSLAISGILFNLFSSVILAAKDMRNSFNLLLIALAFFDSGYLFGSILESFRKAFHKTSDLHILLFPKLLYPGQMIMMTASIFMTVAIAMERYVAVHYPLDYNQAMNDEYASLKRVSKYVVPVTLVSILFNIPKFFEADIKYGSFFNNETQRNESVPYLVVTELRMDFDYHFYYNNCARLLALGIIPFFLLVFYNTKIYQDIQVRRKRRCPRPASSNSNSGERQNNNGTQPNPSHHSQRRQQNANRRRYEDNLAVIFMGIVLFFLVSHLPRIFLGIHELFVAINAEKCNKNGFEPFAVWVHLLTNVSHLLLVINGSVNSLIYCCFSSRFRMQVVKYFDQFALKVGLKKEPTRTNVTNVSGLAGAGQLQLKSSFSVNGVRPSHGMTTYGGPDETPLLDRRNGLTQTTQV